MTIVVLILLALLGVAAGPALSSVKTDSLRRFLGWSVIVVIVGSAHGLLTGSTPTIRMVGLCCVLLSGMKGLVYAEWAAGGQRLTLLRYGVFCFLWFGMDPGSFRKRRQGLSWWGDLRLGFLLMLFGLFLARLVWKLEWEWLIAVFVPMSLFFHFGVLRMLKGAMRRIGFPVRTLFPNVLKAQGLGDFWSRRWNVGYSQMMQRVVGRPVEAFAGEYVGVLAVFIMSGLLHEIAITLPVQSGFGLPTLYFTLHGLLVVLERAFNRPFGKVIALMAVVFPLGWLFPEAFHSEVLVECLNMMTH